MTILSLQDLAEFMGVSYKSVRNWHKSSRVDIPVWTNPSGKVEMVPMDAAEEMKRIYEAHGIKGLRKGWHLPRYELNRVRT